MLTNFMSSICGSDDINDLSEQLETIPTIKSVEAVLDKREYKDSETLYKEKYEKFLDILEQSTNIIILTEDKLSMKTTTTKTQIDFPLQKNILKKYTMIQEPTEEHFAIKTFLRKYKKVKHVITSSYDSLHFLSGLKEEELTEFYGSNFKEYCSKCKTIYQRYFDISKRSSKFRECEKCGGNLIEDKINEGDQIDTETYKKIKGKLKNCDLIIALGCEFLTL